jgi:hypothetical protein
MPPKHSGRTTVQFRGRSRNPQPHSAYDTDQLNCSDYSQRALQTQNPFQADHKAVHVLAAHAVARLLCLHGEPLAHVPLLGTDAIH